MSKTTSLPGLNGTNFTTTPASFTTLSSLTTLPTMPFVTVPNMNVTGNHSNGTAPPNATIPPVLPASCFLPMEDWEPALVTFGYALILAVAIFGNSIIIYVVLKYRNIKTAFNYLILNLAASDILHAVVVCPTHVAFLYLGNVFPHGFFGEALCRLQMYLIVVPISVSVWTMVIIAFDRYLAIVHLMKRPLSVRAVKQGIFLVWFLSAAIFSYEFFRFRIYVNPLNGQPMCVADWGDSPQMKRLDTVDAVVKLVLHYLLPLTIMTVLYSIILMYLWQRKAPGEFNDSHQKRLERQKRKVIKMLVTIVTVFAICWLSVHVSHILDVFHRQMFTCGVSVGIIMFTFMVAHANAAIDPCLYLVFNESFREGFKHIFHKVHRKQITLSDRNSTIREVITGATAIPNSAYESFTPQLTSKITHTDSDHSEENIVDSRV